MFWDFFFLCACMFYTWIITSIRSIFLRSFPKWKDFARVSSSFFSVLLCYSWLIIAVTDQCRLYNTEPPCHWAPICHIRTALSLFTYSFHWTYRVWFWQTDSACFLFSCAEWTDVQLDQLVIDSAMEKREMEHKHATIQQRVSRSSLCCVSNKFETQQSRRCLVHYWCCWLYSHVLNTDFSN